MDRRIVCVLAFAVSFVFLQSPAFAQSREFEKKVYNYNEWTKGKFAEAVTVVNPGKWIFLGGIGAESEGDGKILHMGDFKAQCVYAYQKIKKELALNGVTINHIVKTTTYLTDIRITGEGRKPHTGEKIKIPAAIVPRFRPSKALKDAIN